MFFAALKHIASGVRILVFESLLLTALEEGMTQTDSFNFKS